MPTRRQQKEQQQQQPRGRGQLHRSLSTESFETRKCGSDRSSGGYDDSTSFSCFACGHSTWLSRVSVETTVALKGSASDASGTSRKSDAAGGAGACAGNVQNSDEKVGDGGDAIYSSDVPLPQQQQHHQSDCRVDVTQRVTSVRRVRWNSGPCVSKSRRVLDYDRTASVGYIARPMRAPPTCTSSSSAAGPVSQPRASALVSHSPADSKRSEGSTRKDGCGCCAAAAHVAPGSAPVSPAARVNDGGYGDPSTFSNNNYSARGCGGDDHDGARCPTNSCELGTLASSDGEDGLIAHASSSQAAPTKSPPITDIESTNAASLTYAAATSSSLQGKRLPQARVGFSQWRKRACSSRTSMPSILYSADDSAGSAAAVVPNESLLGTSPRLTDPLASAWHATSTATLIDSPSVEGCESQSSLSSDDEHNVAGGAAQHSSTNAMMPPLPPSVHRHQPTHLILPLPSTRTSPQVHESPNSGEEGALHSGVSRRTQDQKTATAYTELPSPARLPPSISRTSSALATRPPSLQIFVSPLTHSASSLQPPCERTPITNGDTSGAPTTVQPEQRSSTPSSSTALSRTTWMSGDIRSVLHATPQSAAFMATEKGVRCVPSTNSFFRAVEIIPGLFLGSYADATDPQTLAEHGISLVINCTRECSVTPAMACNNNNVRYVQLPLRDHSDEPIAHFFTPVTRIIHDQLHRRQVQQQRMPAHRAAAEAAFVDAHEANKQEHLLWTWMDEADNIWAVPRSPASPLLSVGGQPSLKEGKRETPCTPSSAAMIGIRLSEGTCCSSNTTSFSPSPMPERTATFPPVAAAPIPAALGYLAETPEGGGGGAADPEVVMGAQQNCIEVSGNMPSTTSPTGIASPSFEGSSVTPLASVIASLTAPSVTVVDPRDCGGVLVHCRMGVSRSATFIIAYLILYGCTLAHLDDTASLFVCFLERERRIIEEAGGVASFTEKSGGSVPLTMSATSSRRGSDACTSRALHVLPSSPVTGSVSATALNAHSRLHPNVNGHRPFPQQILGTNTSQMRRPSAVVPTASSPCLGDCAAGTSITSMGGHLTTSSCQHQFCASMMANPIEVASRVCQRCHLLRLRERRLQHHCQRQLLISETQLLHEAGSTQQRRVMKKREPRRGGRLAACSADSVTSDDSCSLHPVQQEHQQPRSACHRRAFSALPSPAPSELHFTSRRSSVVTPHQAVWGEDGVKKGSNTEKPETQRQRRDAQRTTAATTASPATPPQHNRLTLEAPVGVTGAPATALDQNVYSESSPLGEQQQQMPSPLATVSFFPSPHMNSRAPGDLCDSVETLLGVSFVANSSSSGASCGGTTNFFGGATTAMTYRSAFDAVKRQKTDINPNIGFILALRELAGDCDFSSSISL